VLAITKKDLIEYHSNNVKIDLNRYFGLKFLESECNNNVFIVNKCAFIPLLVVVCCIIIVMFIALLLCTLYV